MDITMDYIGGKWKTVVLWYLKKWNAPVCGIKKTHTADITEKMLSIQLKTLEADGLVKRKVHGTKPPEYVLNILLPKLEKRSSLL